MQTGQFEIHRGMFRIQSGPIQNMLIAGTAEGCVGTNAIYLAITIAGAGDDCTSQLDQVLERQKEVWVCPGDAIVLCWSLKRNTCGDGDIHATVRIDPGGYTVPVGQDNKIMLHVPSDYLNNPIEYTATVRNPQDEVLATDSVKVYILEGQWITLNAQPDTNLMCWSIVIPSRCYSAHIVVDHIQLIGNQQACLAWDFFGVEHVASIPYPNNNPILYGTLTDYTPQPIAPPTPILGTWRLFSLDKLDANGNVIAHAPMPNDYHKPVCFRLQGACQ
jgi:hypothetical protein